MTLGPLMIDIAGISLTADDRALLLHPLVGSVILFTRNYRDPAQLRALTAEIHALRSPALLIAVDHEGGRVQRFRSGFSLLPPLRTVGHSFDVAHADGLQLAREHGWLMASELLAAGVDFSFAPCVDLDYGLSEVIGDRALHSRAHAVAELAVAYAHGMREAGMAATAKHFPGHGAVVADSHQALPVDRRELADLEPDLMPYRRLIDNGLPAVMVSHVLYPAVDAVPASFSHRWVSEILRSQMRFKGTIFADDLSMLATTGMGDIVARCQRALRAGCDVLPVCNSRESVMRVVQELQHEPDASLHLRLARMRGHMHLDSEALHSSDIWQHCQQAVMRCGAPAELRLGGNG